MTARSSTLVYLAATLAYAGLAMPPIVMLDPEVFTAHAADGMSWMEPALGLATHGAFVAPDNPARFMNFRPPIYPLFVAFGIWVSDSSFAQLVVIGQVLIFYTSAVIVSRLVESVEPGYGALGFVAFLFNPNALGTVFFVQSETVNAFIVILIATALLRFSRRGDPASGAAAGAAVGAACLTRPEAVFLLGFVPCLLLILGRAGQARPGWLAGAGAGAAALVVGLAVTAPWMAWNASIGDGYRLTASGNTGHYLWGSAAQLEMERSGVDELEAERRMGEAREAVVRSWGENWIALSSVERDRALAVAGFERILSHDSETLTRNVGKATLQFFLAGGAGRIFALMGSPNAAPYAVMVRDGGSSHIDAVLEALRGAELGLIAVWTTAITYVVVARALGLVGIARLLRRGRLDVLLIALGAISFYALVIPFYGLSRFRVAVEGLLVLLAVAGIAAIVEAWKNRPGPR